MYDKITILSKKMIGERSLFTGRLSAESLQKAWRGGRAAFIQDKELKEIIACGVLWFYENSVEIGSMWVDPNYRNNGYGKEVFCRLVAIAPANIRLFIIAHGPTIARLALDHGMQEADRKDWMSAALCPSCDLCKRLPELERSHCSLKFFKEGCRVFFTNNTARRRR